MILWVFRGQERQSHSSFVQEASRFPRSARCDGGKTEYWTQLMFWFFLIIFLFYFIFGGGGMGQEDGSTALKSALQYNWLGLKE